MQITWCTIKENKNVQSQYLLCPGTGTLVCGQTVNIPTTCVKNILDKWTIKIPQQGENLRLYITDKFNLDTINVDINNKFCTEI